MLLLDEYTNPPKEESLATLILPDNIIISTLELVISFDKRAPSSSVRLYTILSKLMFLIVALAIILNRALSIEALYIKLPLPSKEPEKGISLLILILYSP